MDPKRSPEAGWHRLQDPGRYRRSILFIAALVALLYLLSEKPSWRGFHSLLPQPLESQIKDSSAFYWGNVTPEKDLVYHDCYDRFQCARLQLPLDYNSTEIDAPTIAVAVIRLPAKVPVTDSRYGGAIIINPGGPGGSGVERLLSAGMRYQNIADAERHPEEAIGDDKYFDFIGFDPRGVNNTVPTVFCFPDSISHQAWNLQVESEGVFGSGVARTRTLYQRARARSVGCSTTLNTLPGYDGFASHINTPSVVADMVEIVERHGEWRAEQGRKAQQQHGHQHTRDAEAAIRQRTRYIPGEEPLQYWGFSYGTLLGATFAAMQPHRVSRMVLDGVVSSDAYYTGDRFENLHDADKVLDHFFYFCSEAGPERCPFWRVGGEEAIRTAYHRLLDDMKYDPLPVPGTAERGPELITYSNIKSVVAPAIYQPLLLFPMLATLLEDVAQRNGSIFAEQKHKARRPSYRTPECEAAGPYSWACNLFDWEPESTSLAILCTEALTDYDLSEAEYGEIVEGLRNQSSALGDTWAQYLLGCTGWNATASWLYDGPIEGDTAHPILWVSSKYDPVTPLRNAEKMAAKFPGSVLLQQNSVGHSSISAPSVCTASAIRKYFQTGQLPPDGTVCETDLTPLIDSWPAETADIDKTGLLNDVLEVVKKTRTILPGIHAGFI